MLQQGLKSDAVAKVTIQRIKAANSFVSLAYSLGGKISSYNYRAVNTYKILYNGGVDPNAFHHYINDIYASAANDSISQSNASYNGLYREFY